ncbi:putative cyclin-D6-1 isoform X1 [Syzygium oleosum]|uniref:putative cyclin-D6-1 isoform X1 n=1 Tax=Syzygium oleosum TaxID=219896 RepID=UPI0011D2234B|nr:putative cyclin-D6-1 isoform X1 [Syzygium oleosum]
MEFDLENPLTNFDDRFPDKSFLFLVESDHMPSEKYVAGLRSVGCSFSSDDLSVRRDVVSSVSQLSCGFDPALSYLAINYVDRFLSSHKLQKPKPWVLRLLAVSCVALAAKMLKTEIALADVQSDGGGFIFDAHSIQKMELLVLGALQWRMRSITPFCFISFFVSLFELRDPPLGQAIQARASEIILKAQNDIKLLEFKPSITAASALLCACHELFPLQFASFKSDISSCSYVNKDNLLHCYNAMQDGAMDGFGSALDVHSSSDTPINVLDHHFSCSDSEMTNVAASTVRSQRALKRRKTQ